MFEFCYCMSGTPKTKIMATTTFPFATLAALLLRCSLGKRSRSHTGNLPFADQCYPTGRSSRCSVHEGKNFYIENIIPFATLALLLLHCWLHICRKIFPDRSVVLAEGKNSLKFTTSTCSSFCEKCSSHWTGNINLWKSRVNQQWNGYYCNLCHGFLSLMTWNTLWSYRCNVAFLPIY